MQRTLVLPLFLACAIVGGALWALDYYAGRLSRPLFASDAAQSHTQFPALESKKANNNRVASPATITVPPAAPEALIEKCIKDGRTLYSNVDCAGHADALPVPLHEASGIVSPNKALLSRLETERHVRERSAHPTSKTVAVIGSGTASECGDLIRQIDYYDALARHPNPTYTQDWIRERRKAVRDRQFALHCP